MGGAINCSLISAHFYKPYFLTIQTHYNRVYDMASELKQLHLKWINRCSKMLWSSIHRYKRSQNLICYHLCMKKSKVTWLLCMERSQKSWWVFIEARKLSLIWSNLQTAGNSVNCNSINTIMQYKSGISKSMISTAQFHKILNTQPCLLQCYWARE